MNILLDTNVLLRRLEPAHPQFADADAAVVKLLARGYTPCLVSQVLYEVWVALTRPVSANGLGKSVAEADATQNRLIGAYPVFDDVQAIRPTWHQLVVTHAVLGKPAHDARLVAAMTVHGLTHLLTFNDADFRRFPAVTVLTPADVLAMP